MFCFQNTNLGKHLGKTAAVHLLILLIIKNVWQGESASLPDFLDYSGSNWDFSDDSSTQLNFNFKYFGRDYSSLYLGSNGIITFGESVTSTWIGRENCTREGTVPIIMAFWSDVYPRDGGKITYYSSEYRSRLDPLLAEVQRAYPNQQNQLTRVFVASWKNVSYHNAAEEDYKKTNYFHIVLTTDNVRFYVLFYYSQIQWPLPTYDKPATAGFIDNNGNVAKLLADTCGHCVTTSVIKKSNVGIPGKWVFRVDSGIPKTDLSFGIRLSSEQLTKLASSLADGDWKLTVNARSENEL